MYLLHLRHFASPGHPNMGQKIRLSSARLWITHALLGLLDLVDNTFWTLID